MKRRFTINDAGELEDREGNVLGRVVGITIDFGKRDPWGDYRGVLLTEDEGKDTPLPPEQTALIAGSDLIAEVWATYVEVMNPRQKALDAETRKIIRDALKVADVSECKRAIVKCSESSFHMGKNDQNRKYNKPSHILKGRRGGVAPARTTRETIDWFLDLDTGSGRGSVTSAGNARITQAKRDVLDGFEFPGDEHVVRRAAESEEFLRSVGIQVTRDEDTGRPRFSA